MPNMTDTPTFNDMTIIEKIKYFKGKQTELVELEQKMKQATQLNQAELQLAFGLTPGKPVSIVDLVTIVAEVVGEKITANDRMALCGDK